MLECPGGVEHEEEHNDDQEGGHDVGLDIQGLSKEEGEHGHGPDYAKYGGQLE